MNIRVYSHWYKVMLVLPLIMIGCFGTGPSLVHADSPLTSTAIYKAYLDVDMVVEAEHNGLNKNVADFLKSPDTPLDAKAAAVNALYSGQVWSDRDIAEEYSLLTYGKKTAALDKKKLAPEESFVLGYMKILDRYMEPDLSWITEAKRGLPDSRTVALIHMLGVSQQNMDCSWNYAEEVLADTGLKQDIRQEAVEIIVEYMELYKGSPCQPGTGPTGTTDTRINDIVQNSVVLSVGNANVFVKGSKSQVDPANLKVEPYIRNGRTMVPLCFLSDKFGAAIQINSNTRAVTVVYNKQKMVLSESKKEMEIVHGRTFVPLRTVMDLFGKQTFYYKGLIIIPEGFTLDALDPQDQHLAEKIRLLLLT